MYKVRIQPNNPDVDGKYGKEKNKEGFYASKVIIMSPFRDLFFYVA